MTPKSCLFRPGPVLFVILPKGILLGHSCTRQTLFLHLFEHQRTSSYCWQICMAMTKQIFSPQDVGAMGLLFQMVVGLPGTTTVACNWPFSGWLWQAEESRWQWHLLEEGTRSYGAFWIEAGLWWIVEGDLSEVILIFQINGSLCKSLAGALRPWRVLLCAPLKQEWKNLLEDIGALELLLTKLNLFCVIVKTLNLYIILSCTHLYHFFTGSTGSITYL